MDGQLLLIALAPGLGDRDFARAIQIRGGQAVFRFQYLFQRAFGHDRAAMDASAGAKVNDPICSADRVFVMLDHDDGVAQVAQAAQRGEQAVIVLLVQADARLIEHIEHARQAGADLAGQADALALPAGQGSAGPVKVEIIKPDIVEEAQPLVDFLQDRLGNLLLLIGQGLVDAAEPLERVTDAHFRGCGDIDACDLDAECLGLQARAVAGFAWLRRLIFRQFLAHPRAVGLQQAAVEIAYDALERLVDRIFLAPVLESQRDRHAARAVQDDKFLVRQQFFPRRIQAEAIGLGEAGQHLHIIRAWWVGFRPRHNCAFFQRQMFVGDHQLRVKFLPLTKAITIRTGALRGVEREQARRDFGNGEARDRAGELL